MNTSSLRLRPQITIGLWHYMMYVTNMELITLYHNHRPMTTTQCDLEHLGWFFSCPASDVTGFKGTSFDVGI